MKSTLLILAAVAGLPLLTQAQALPTFTNGDLETWSVRNGVEAPAGWITIDDALADAGLPPLLAPRTVTKSSDVHGGRFAAQLQSVELLLRPGTTARLPVLRGMPQRVLAHRRDDAEADLPGLLIKGSINEDGDLVGLPYTGRPASLRFWYKLTGPAAAADSAFAGMVLTRKSEELADAGEILAPQSTYTLMDIPLTYRSAQAPDSIQLLITVSNSGKPSTTSRLFVDDVQLVGTVTGTNHSAAAAALQVYPNPSANGEFSLASLTDAALSTAPFTVTDATGRVVLRKAAAPVSEARGRFVDLRSQRAGVYLLRLEAPAGPVVRKLVIQ